MILYTNCHPNEQNEFEPNSNQMSTKRRTYFITHDATLCRQHTHTPTIRYVVDCSLYLTLTLQPPHEFTLYSPTHTTTHTQAYLGRNREAHTQLCCSVQTYSPSTQEKLYLVYTLLRTHSTQDTFYLGHILPRTHSSQDTFYLGHILPRTHSTLDTFYFGHTKPRTHSTQDTPYLGHILPRTLLQCSIHYHSLILYHSSKRSNIELTLTHSVTQHPKLEN